MQETRFKWIELLLLFVFVPVSLVFPLYGLIKGCVILGAVIYLIWISARLGLFSKLNLIQFELRSLLWGISLRFIAFAVISAVAMWLLMPDSFFKVLINKPLLWLFICVFYSVFSVYPQEFIYRSFFCARYQDLIHNPHLFILLNAIIFSLAHVMFMNVLVLVLTFFGGLLFTRTYLKTNSLMLVSVEHSFYGLWLFTIGMGDMLAFPS